MAEKTSSHKSAARNMNKVLVKRLNDFLSTWPGPTWDLASAPLGLNVDATTKTSVVRKESGEYDGLPRRIIENTIACLTNYAADGDAQWVGAPVTVYNFQSLKAVDDAASKNWTAHAEPTANPRLPPAWVREGYKKDYCYFEVPGMPLVQRIDAADVAAPEVLALALGTTGVIIWLKPAYVTKPKFLSDVYLAAGVAIHETNHALNSFGITASDDLEEQAYKRILAEYRAYAVQAMAFLAAEPAEGPDYQAFRTAVFEKLYAPAAAYANDVKAYNSDCVLRDRIKSRWFERGEIPGNVTNDPDGRSGPCRPPR